MPALTNSRLGSSRITEALGTSVCPAATKWSVNRFLISWVCTVCGVSLGVVSVAAGGGS